MASQYDSTTAFLQGVAQQALTAASNNASRIYSLPPNVNLRRPDFDITLDKPNIGPPPTFSDLFGSDSTDPSIQYMDEQADKWVSKYFPELNACFKNLPEETLCGILTGTKPFGIDKTVFELVWHQARDRARRTVTSEQRTLAAEFSARGFQLPPGAYADGMVQIAQRGTESVLDVNRDQAMKDAEIKQRMLEVALQLATQLKLGVLNALADFYRMWISVSEQDIEKARVRAQAMAALYQALSSYYNVEIAFQNLRLDAARVDAETDINVDRNELTRQGNFGPVASALGTATAAMADTAAAASQAGGSLTAQVETF
jgi:hypothetical protein